MAGEAGGRAGPAYTPAVADAPPDWADANRRMWDERVPIHVGSDFYDVAGFKAGEPAVQPFEIEELGALGGRRMLHLQCHFGLDTLDLVRLHPTLEAVGLDFSAPAIEAASRLAAELELDHRARFVEADARDAVAAVGAGGFDLVYTGKGAIIWLPDLDAWAAQCMELLRPGGWLYLCEFHPVGYCFDEEQPVLKYDYFDADPIVDESEGTYADLSAPTRHNVSYEWQQQIPKVLNAILGAGFRLRFYHEWDHTLFELNKWLVKGDDGRFRFPGRAKVPLMYSLKAEKPAD